MKRLVVLLVIVLFAFFSTTPQILPDTHTKIRHSIAARDYAAAIAELQALKTRNPESFVANNYDYLLARMAESDGQLSVAMSTYQAVANRNSVLQAYALKHLSQIARSTGNLLLERIYLTDLLLNSPDSLLASSARLRLAHNGFESGNYGETIRILNSRVRTIPDNSFMKTNKNGYFRDNYALLGESFLRSGQIARAREIFTELLDKMPNSLQPDDAALTAAKGLDLLEVGGENFGKKVPELTETEHLRRAGIYQFNRELTNAKLHFEAMIARFPNSSNAAEAIFQIGRGYTQQGEFVEALKWYERVHEQYPESASASESLLQAASAYGRVSKQKEAISRYQSFIEKYPADEKLDRAYLNIVDVLRDHGDDTDALKWCAKTQDAFRGKPPEAIALFAEARIYFTRDDWPRALDALERLRQLPNLGGSTVPGGTNDVEVSFLRAFVLEQLKRYAEAIDAYLSIPDGRSEYYGWRATERLKMLSADETAGSFVAQKSGALAAAMKAKDGDVRRKAASAILRMEVAPDMRERALGVLKNTIATLPKYQGIKAFKLDNQDLKESISQKTIARGLLFLGLYDEAALELEAAMPNATQVADDQAFTLATYYTRGDRADRGLAFIEPIWKKIPADYPTDLIPHDQLELLYPTPYADALLKSTSKGAVDPRLILAIMRQESRFQPDALSSAGARGLMQFISTTSKQVAGETGRDNFRQADLYYPPNAIFFGAQYLADLFEAFPGQPDAVVASYNGGADNMKRWLARSQSSLPERYVPEIVYSQSKDYVYKVMTNYRMYQYLYDEKLQPR